MSSLTTIHGSRISSETYEKRNARQHFEHIRREKDATLRMTGQAPSRGAI